MFTRTVEYKQVPSTGDAEKDDLVDHDEDEEDSGNKSNNHSRKKYYNDESSSLFSSHLPSSLVLLIIALIVTNIVLILITFTSSIGSSNESADAQSKAESAFSSPLQSVLTRITAVSSLSDSSIRVRSNNICSVPYPPAAILNSGPLVEKWNLCPIPHFFPPLSERVDPFPPHVGVTDNHDYRHAQTNLEKPRAEFPKIFFLDVNTDRFVEVLIYEATYGMKDGHWTIIVTMTNVIEATGETIDSRPALCYPVPDAETLLQTKEYLTCVDTISGHTTYPIVEWSWNWIKFHCPFPLHPATPQDVALEQKDRISQFLGKRSSNNVYNITDSSGFPMKVDVLIRHPLFRMGKWQDMRKELDNVKSKVASAGGIGSNLAVLFPPATRGALKAEMCLHCMPRVYVSYCHKPMINSAYVKKNILASIAHYTSLGVERFDFTDHWGWYEGVLSDYIANGIVSYRLQPLPYWSVQRDGTRICTEILDQGVGVEACRMRQYSTAEWMLGVDQDEWVSFPPASFVDEKKFARCFHPTWTKSSDMVKKATGNDETLMVKLIAPEIDDTLITDKPWLSSTSPYYYYKEEIAKVFFNRHRELGLTYPQFKCSSPLHSWLQAISDLNLIQSETNIPYPETPLAHHSDDGLLPVTLPYWASSSGNWKFGGPPNPPPKSESITGMTSQPYRLEYFALCQTQMRGPTTDTDEGDGSMIYKYRKHWAQGAQEQPDGNKWIARPSANSIHVHTWFDQEAVNRGAPNVDAHDFDRYERRQRPCEEIHHMHFVNYPSVRAQPDPNQPWIENDELIRRHKAILEMGKKNK